MFTITARNVNCALLIGSQLLRDHGVKRPSRNGDVLVAPTPVTTIYEEPMERVLLWPKRDANPFFHLFEALWMLAGRDDLQPLLPFVSQMAAYSDDGATLHGAYGHRWTHHFHIDQVAWAIDRLAREPDDRRVVIQMYDARVDVERAENGGKDIPCNLCALPFICPAGRLNLTVYNRSNDMVWGAYGANAVHFSLLQETIAAGLGIPVGQYYQVSNNFHWYESLTNKVDSEWPWGKDGDELNPDPYLLGHIAPMPLFGTEFQQGKSPRDALKEFRSELQVFIDDPSCIGLQSRFLRRVAGPMMNAHSLAKSEGIAAARKALDAMPTRNDWKAAAHLWMSNREAAARRARAEDDGVFYEESR